MTKITLSKTGRKAEQNKEWTIVVEELKARLEFVIFSFVNNSSEMGKFLLQKKRKKKLSITPKRRKCQYLVYEIYNTFLCEFKIKMERT